jgi:hypothetical protein
MLTWFLQRSAADINKGVGSHVGFENGDGI